MSNTEIIIEGWKGKDSLEFNEEEGFYLVTEHRKNKETGEINTNTHQIPKKNVAKIYQILKDNFKKGQTVKYQELINLVIKENGLSECNRDNFNGGRNRAKYYFPYYYYPLKVLEYFNLIQYFGRGSVKLLDKVGAEDNWRD